MFEYRDRNAKIGIFDSGLGGITVLSRAKSILPNERFIYYADSDNVPYGEKKKEQIVEYLDKAIFYMVENGCKAVVIACNTATSVGVDFLRKKYNFIQIIGIEPAVKPALLRYNRKGMRVLVVATPITVNGKKLDHLIKTYDKKGIVDKKALPKLVSFAEEGVFDAEIIVPYLKEELSGFDLYNYSSVVLGCTHFPFFKDSFESIMPQAMIIDGSNGCSNYLKRRLEEENMLSDAHNIFGDDDPQVEFVESGRVVKDKAVLEKINKLCTRWKMLYL